MEVEQIENLLLMNFIAGDETGELDDFREKVIKGESVILCEMMEDLVPSDVVEWIEDVAKKIKVLEEESKTTDGSSN